MVTRLLTCVVWALLACVSTAIAAEPAKVGDTVWAQWAPNGWFHGQATRAADVGLHIVFDDGDEADLPLALVAVDKPPAAGEVKVGTHLLALWTDGHYYPGVVASVVGGQYAIQFDDGDRRTVGLAELRLVHVGKPLGAAAQVGDRVWAQWLPNDWYPGKVDRVTDRGVHVAFDDGDEANLPLALVAVDKAPAAAAVKVGVHLLARFKGGDYYPGVVTGVANGQYTIRFDDGDRDEVGLDDLRLLHR